MIPVRMGYIGTGDEAIYNTIELMKELIKRGERDMVIRQLATQLVSGVPERDERGEVATIFNFLKSKTRFTKDPAGFEFLQTPRHILEQLQQGIKPHLDCDDMTVLGGALLRTVGYPVRLKAISVSPTREYTHIYLLVKIGDSNCCWLAFDPANPVSRLGIEPQGITRYHIEEVEEW